MRSSSKVQVGADVLIRDRPNLIAGKRLGVITNHSAFLASGEHLVDALSQLENVELKALFGPEHGIRGNAPDRKSISHQSDPISGVPTFSLFGKTTKPTKAMLEDIDVLIFDIQDVGARFYTYSTTLALTMEAAAQKGIPYIVLDRPNPIGGILVEGPLLDKNLRSFVGWLPIPIVHGLTIGELARAINGEGWLPNHRQVELHVVPMEGWRRNFYFDQTRLHWIKPSPSICSIQTALVYPGTCLIEGTNVSEGRGTRHPFEQVGAPWIDGKLLAKKVSALGIPGLEVRSTSFTPRSTRAVTTDSKFEGMRCEGLFLRVTDRARFRPVRAALGILSTLRQLHPEEFFIRPKRFDELAGSKSIRKALLKGIAPDEIAADWIAGEQDFEKLRKQYYIYKS